VTTKSAKQFLSKKTKGSNSVEPLDLRWVILLDNESITDLCYNSAYLAGIYKTKGGARVDSNGGYLQANHKGKVSGYWNDLWYDKKAIANIIALKNLKKQYRISYDSESSDAFIVHREDKGLPNIEFKMHPLGLYYYDPREHNRENIFVNLAIDKSIFVNTVSENMKGYSKREIKGGERAKKLYSTLLFPS